MKSVFLSLTLLSFVFLSGVLEAHQQKESYTTVKFNERTNRIEIMQRFYLHDAEHALNRMLDRKADIIRDKATQAAFAEYVQQNFGLKDADKNQLPLSYVGFETEGKYLWVYQETPMISSPAGFWVTMTALQEVWPRQTNQVNFEYQGQVKAVRLKQNDGWKFVAFE